MDTVNSDIKETAPVPASVPAPAVSAPEVTATPAAEPVSVGDLAGSLPRTGTPKASPSTGGLGAGAPAPAFNGELPKTTGKTPGGWNRFAGYNPNDAKNKKNDRRDNKGRR
jgi:hypothetical protein